MTLSASVTLKGKLEARPYNESSALEPASIPAFHSHIQVDGVSCLSSPAPPGLEKGA
jgi:hypothetical protein